MKPCFCIDVASVAVAPAFVCVVVGAVVAVLVGATSSERHCCQVGQNSKQEGLMARAPSDAVNYANELIREA